MFSNVFRYKQEHKNLLFKRTQFTLRATWIRDQIFRGSSGVCSMKTSSWPALSSDLLHLWSPSAAVEFMTDCVWKFMDVHVPHCCCLQPYPFYVRVGGVRRKSNLLLPTYQAWECRVLHSGIWLQTILWELQTDCHFEQGLLYLVVLLMFSITGKILFVRSVRKCHKTCNTTLPDP